MSALKNCSTPGCAAVLVAVHSDSIFDGVGLRRSDFCSPCWQKTVRDFDARVRAREERIAANPPPPRRPSAAEQAAAREQARLAIRLESQELKRQSRVASQAAGRANDPNEQASLRLEAARLLEQSQRLLERIEPEPKEERTDREREAETLERRADLVSEEGMASLDRDEAAARFREAADLREAAKKLRDNHRVEAQEGR